MKKWFAIALMVLVLLLVGAIAAGPFIAYHGIRDAVQAQDTRALAQHVDFPALRANLKARVEDELARRAGPDAQSSLLGAFALRAASSLADGAIDAMVTPAGIAAMLEGRQAWQFARGNPVDDRQSTDVAARGPLHDPDYGFESPSRFTATVDSGAGTPVTLVLSRQGLRWRLTDIIPGHGRQPD